MSEAKMDAREMFHQRLMARSNPERSYNILCWLIGRDDLMIEEKQKGAA
ncbi:MAG: hypothetical protein IKV90_05200 [Clostridia bacterium]|nr:hypothetical protein [Clostridia bacterium]